jgi:hypothetical protein
MSDVRYLLRQPSTPWIVFDQSAKDTERSIPLELSTSTSTLTSTSTRSSTSTQATLGSPTPPSAFSVEQAPEMILERAPRSPWTARFLAGLGVTLLAIGLTMFATRGGPRPAGNAAVIPEPPPPVQLQVTQLQTTQQAPMPSEPTTQLAAPISAAVHVDAAGPTNAPSWLAIRGAAAGERVYLDGKLLLGTGPRAFAVKCGTHSVAVGAKKKAHDVDVPCGAELIVGE